MADPFATNLCDFHARAEATLTGVPDGTFTKVPGAIADCLLGKVYRYHWKREGFPDTLVVGKTMKSELVKESKDRQANDRVAHFTKKSCVEDALNEIGIMAYLKQQEDVPVFLLKMITAYEQGPNTLLMTEHIEGGELFSLVANDDKFSEDRPNRFLHQMLQAVNYLHNHRIAHRDISLENTLVTFANDELGDIRLMDFGQGCTTHSPCGTQLLRYFCACGKNYYRAPECFVPPSQVVQVRVPPGKAPGEVIFTQTDKGYLCEVRLPNDAQPEQVCQAEVFGYVPMYSDMFAVGVWFFILVWHVPPWQSACLWDGGFRYVCSKGIPSLIHHWHKPPLSNRLQELLSRLMCPDPTRRPFANTCLAEYF